MILPTMSDEQRIKELNADFKRFWLNFTHEVEPKWDKMALKLNKFPKIFRWSAVSPNNNKLTIAGNVYSRRAVREGYALMMYTTMRSQKGSWLFMCSYRGSESFLYMFPPHALDRYRERLDLELSDAEVVTHYIDKQLSSNGGGEIDIPTGRAIMATEDGIWMGNFVSENAYIFKTFVDNGHLYENQMEEGNNAMADYQEFVDLARKYYKKLRK